MNRLFRAELPDDLKQCWQALLACVRDGTALPKATTPETENFLQLYAPIAAPAGNPIVVAQLGQSLDGYIATRTGASHYVTGPESLIHLHRLRALCDAVVVAWRTVDADDPQLTVRNVQGENPLRVVVDIEGKLPGTKRVFSQEQGGSLRLTGAGTPPLHEIGSSSVTLDGRRAEPKSVVEALAGRGCKRILIEGGGRLVSEFLAAGALDRLHLAVAPLIIGEGRRGLSIPAVDSLDQALRPKCRHYSMGNDILFDLDLAPSNSQ